MREVSRLQIPLLSGLRPKGAEITTEGTGSLLWETVEVFFEEAKSHREGRADPSMAIQESISLRLRVPT